MVLFRAGVEKWLKCDVAASKSFETYFVSSYTHHNDGSTRRYECGCERREGWEFFNLGRRGAVRHTKRACSNGPWIQGPSAQTTMLIIVAARHPNH